MTAIGLIREYLAEHPNAETRAVVEALDLGSPPANRTAVELVRSRGEQEAGSDSSDGAVTDTDESADSKDENQDGQDSDRSLDREPRFCA